MRKLVVGIAVIVISLFLVSCSGDSGRASEINYKKGTLDLDVVFSGNKEEFQEREFKLPTVIHNQLAYDINEVKVSLVGLDKTYVDLFIEEESFSLLEGRSVFNSEGGKQRLEFAGVIKSLLPGAEKNLQNYRLYINYNSKVEFSPTICVSNNLYSDVDDGGCSIEREFSYSGQGAPLAVSKMTVVPGDEIELRMTIENKGKGKVGTVSLGTATLGSRPLNCEFRSGEEGKASFTDKKTEIQLICKQTLRSASSYETAIFVELLYNYELNVKNQLTILK